MSLHLAWFFAVLDKSAGELDFSNFTVYVFFLE
jgi:hypothetical protein